MRALRQTRSNRSRRPWTVALAWATCIVWSLISSFSPANAASEPIRITIDRPVAVPGGATYAVHVIAAGTPIFVIASDRVHSAYLEVNGSIVESGGSAQVIHRQPFGHTVTSLRLSDVTPRDRVVVRTVGGGANGIRVASDVPLLTQAANTGFFTGLYFAFLLLIALFQALTPTTSRDRTNLWYAGWALLIAIIAAGRDGFFGVSGPPRAIVPLAVLLMVACSVGFTASFLRLRREAPRLFLIAIASNAAAFVAPPIIMLLIHRQEEWLFMGGLMAAMLPLIVAALARRRAGFMPATALAAALCLNFVTLGLQIVLGAASVAPSFLLHWGMEVATVVNLTALTVALIVRRRYALREIEGLEAELGRSHFNANHDALTGLLNRRGLDEWMSGSGHTVSTVFFIDLDGFKAVNDRGGHAAGDDVLRVVSRIIRHAVRECDAVARVGGDEFVIALGGALTELQTMELRRRISVTVSELEPLGERDATRIGASVGVGTVGFGTTIDEALRAADADAYRIKFGRYAEKRTSRTHG